MTESVCIDIDRVVARPETTVLLVARPQSDTACPTTRSEPARPLSSSQSRHTADSPTPTRRFGPLAATGHTLAEAVPEGNPPLQASAALRVSLSGVPPPLRRALSPRSDLSGVSVNQHPETRRFP
jgi:hypothetical protein